MSKKMLIMITSTLALACGQEINHVNKNAQTPNTVATSASVSVSPANQITEPGKEIEPNMSGGKADSYKPKQGYVPDAKTAIKIAEAVWLPIYGEKVLKDERPFQATLENGVWIVNGTLPQGMLGGTAEARISKETGCILRVIHYK
ncbi:MAG: YbbC/YhhH family protein [Blastocatellia bacterium]